MLTFTLTCVDASGNRHSMMVNGDHGSVALLYGEVENILARLHNIQDKDRKAFRARLRHFRNLGIPPLPKVGSGTRISYSLDELYELFFALELMQCGLSPATIEHLSGRFRKDLSNTFGTALAAPKKEFCLGLSVDQFGGEIGDKITFTSIFLPKSQLITEFFGSKGVEQHVLILKLYQRLHQLHESLDEVIDRKK